MRFVCFVTLAAIVACSGTAAAQDGGSEDAKREAKTLADEGMAHFQRGDMTSAVDRFVRAEALVPLPTITVQRARALERLGRWVEAKEAYESVTNATIPANAPFVHRMAKDDADKELAVLAPKIPKVSLVIVPASKLEVEITVDGRTVRDPQASPFMLVDPGERLIEVRRADGLRAKQAVTVSSGEERTVEIDLAAPVVAPVEPPKKAMHPLRLAGWIGIGVGSGALFVATVTGLPAIAIRGDLSDQCPNDVCPKQAWDDLDAYDALRWTAGIHLIAGIVLVGAGTTTVLLTPAHEDETTDSAISFEPLVGAGTVGGRWTF